METQVYQLPRGGAVQARPGQFVRCDCFGRFLRIEPRLTNGLGLTYQAMPQGWLQRVFF